MDDSEIAEDVESEAHTAPSLPSQERLDILRMDWRALDHVIKGGGWENMRFILEHTPEAINLLTGEDKDTPLVVAIREEATPIIRKLIDRTTPKGLAISSENGWSALHWAAFKGNVPLAKLLIAKNPELPDIRDRWGHLPVQLAASQRQIEMTHFLLSVTKEIKRFSEDTVGAVLNSAIASGMYVIALLLFLKFGRTSNLFAPYEDKTIKPAGPLLALLVEHPQAFPSGTRLNMWQSILYCCVPENFAMWIRELMPTMPSQRHVTVQFSGGFWSAVYQGLLDLTSKVFQILAGPILDIIWIKGMHGGVLLLLFIFSLIMRNWDKEKVFEEVGPLFMSAVKNGITEVVARMVQRAPDLIKYRDGDGKNALQLAVEYRQEEVFSILHQAIERYEKRPARPGPNEKPVINYKDYFGDGFLHLLAQPPRRDRLNAGSRVVLQVQREIQWYQEVEKLVPAELRFEKKKGKTPIQAFEEEHQKLVDSESKWMRGMAQSCMVGGTLIAGVVFAAAISVPGGNRDDGYPNFSKQRAFEVFAFTDTFALVSSLAAVVIFLSIFTSRYSINDYLYDLPNRLIIGLICLLLALISMMITFSATVYLVFAEEHDWIVYPAIALPFMPAIFFVHFQLPSLINMIKTTYGRNIFEHRK